MKIITSKYIFWLISCSTCNRCDICSESGWECVWRSGKPMAVCHDYVLYSFLVRVYLAFGKVCIVAKDCACY